MTLPGLLLDVTNLHINALTLGYDEWQYLSSLDPDRVVQMHVAGYNTDIDGRLWDSHTGGVEQQVLELASWVFGHTACRAAIIERDVQLSHFADVAADIRLLREVYQAVIG